MKTSALWVAWSGCFLLACSATHAVDARDAPDAAMPNAEGDGDGDIAPVGDGDGSGDGDGDIAPVGDGDGDGDSAAPVDAGPPGSPHCFEPEAVQLACRTLPSNYPGDPIDPRSTAIVRAPWVRAQDIAGVQGARIVHLHDLSVILRVGEGDAQQTLVAYIDPARDGSEPTFTTYTLSTEGVLADAELVDTLDSVWVDDNTSGMGALTCDRSNERCWIAIGAGPDATELTLLPDSELPASLGARGIVQGLDDYSLCAYGTGGIACFDGSTWQLEEGGEGADIVAVESSGEAVAVGTNGTLIHRVTYDPKVLPTETDETLVWGSVLSTCWAAVTESGAWIEGCEGGEPTRCLLEPRPVSITYLWSNHEPLEGRRVITEAGDVFRFQQAMNGAPPQWCLAQSSGEDKHVIGVSEVMCGIITNTLIATEDAIYLDYERYFCAVD